MLLLKDVVRDFKRDLKVARRIRVRGWGWFFLVGGSLLLMLLLIAVGRFDDLGDSVLGCACGIGFAIAVKWELKRCAWFWTTIGIVTALNVPFILLVHLPTQLTSGPSIGPILLITLPDFFVVLLIVDVVGRLVKRYERASQRR